MLLALIAGRLQVLLARRSGKPYAGTWALPGGVVRIDLDASLEAAAQRVARERLGTDVPGMRQLCAVGGPRRDPRAPWAVSIVYRGLLPTGSTMFTAGKRIDALEWQPVEDAMTARLAFDHAVLLGRAVEATRAEIERLDLPYACLPGLFTLGELQSTCEQLLGHPIDKSSFRRKLADRNLLEAAEGEFRSGAFRPAQLYRRRPQHGPKPMSDRPREAKHLGAEGAVPSPPRRPGKSNAAYARRSIAAGHLPASLPDARERCFAVPPEAIRVTLDPLRGREPVAPEAYFWHDAPRRMAATCSGALGRRRPSNVIAQADGSFLVLDGAVTLAVARRFRWQRLPVTLSTEPSGADAAD